MNKKFIINVLLALVALSGHAQELKMNEPSLNDYLPLLKAKGYQAYSFDVSAIKGRNVTFNVREFVNGKEVEDSPRLLMPYTIQANGDKLIIGFLPSETDSLALFCFSLENTLSFTSSLKLRQIYWESENKYIYSYVSRPFELTSPLDKEAFIPLVFYSSFWYDAEYKVTRCCGENFIKPDLSSDIPNQSPHYYAIGITTY
ncbi:MAG: DUF5041 domain-containing protein [Bacteroidales bacterium]|nr:DUF5041 domain-containing protein [Bacteroidales bacterium]